MATGKDISDKYIQKDISNLKSKKVGPFLNISAKVLKESSEICNIVIKAVDLSKVFVTINYDFLIGELYANGFSEDALKLIISYMTDRWQKSK